MMRYDAFPGGQSRRQPISHIPFWCSIMSRGGGMAVL